MLDSLLSKINGLQVSLTLSVQEETDRQHLASYFPDADIFYPRLETIDDLRDQYRYRSAIHSEILNQAWERKPSADFAILSDNDILVTKMGGMLEILEHMNENNYVAFGTSYPENNFLTNLLRRVNVKPLNVPNCIFCILDLNYYGYFSNICDFNKRLRKNSNPYFGEIDDERVKNKMADTGTLVYLNPIRDKKKFLTIKCKNTFHNYFPENIKQFFLGGPFSPEMYSSLYPLIEIHHFKKLSFQKHKNSYNPKKAYFKWLGRVS